MIKLGILGSTRGTHLLSLTDAIHTKILDANIEVVISNKEDALILTRAKTHKIPAYFINTKDITREKSDTEISRLLHQHQVDLIVLIGYMRILSASFVQEWPQKIINIHPSLLPRHAGKMDLAVHQSVLDAKEQESGCTVHYVTEIVDAGDIVLQSRCSVYSHDTVESLKSRVQQLEANTLIQAIQQLANSICNH